MNRVYVHDGEVWTLGSAYATRHPLPPAKKAGEYVVYETPHPPYLQEVCLRLDDGRLLCDFGPEHDHSGYMG